MQDVRYALRGLWHNKTLAAVAISCLALGIGLNTTIFSIIDGVLLQPYPYDDPDRIVVIDATRRDDIAGLSVADMGDLKAATSSSLATIAGAVTMRLSMTDGAGDPERFLAARISWDLFRLLGTRPILGRDFLAADDVANGPGVVLISHSLWSVRYRSDPGVVGRSVRIEGKPHVIIGVMPPGFAFPEVQRLWVPLQPQFSDSPRDARFVLALGRLAPGVGDRRAFADLEAAAARLAIAYPATNGEWSVRLQTLHQAFLPRDVSLVLGLMMAGATLVLFIACSNVANLLLTRAMDRRRELAVRIAAGASRIRLIRQLLTEGLVLGLISVPPGLLLAAAGTRLIAAQMPVDAVPYYIQWNVDARSMAYTVAIAVATAVVFGLVPALQTTRRELQDNLKETARGSTSSGAWVRNALVVAQVALAVVALVGALLFVRSFRNIDTFNLGFRTGNILTLRFYLTGDAYEPFGAKWRRVEDVIRRVEALPGVEAASASDLLPIAGGGFEGEIDLEGRPNEPGRRPRISFAGVTPSFHRVLAVTVRRGRDFTASDAGQPFAIVNETLARRVWQGDDPLGRRFKLVLTGGKSEWLTVIGVAPDLWLTGIDLNNAQPSSWAIAPFRYWETPNPGLTIRTAGDPAAVASLAREAIRASDPNVPIYNVRSLEEVRQREFWEYGLYGWVFGSIGGIGLLLAAIGVFGVVASSVAQRTREMGVRMALGADRGRVLWLVLGQGLRLTGIGVAIGFVLARAGTPVARELLYGVSPFDPFSFGAVSAFLIAVGLLGSYVPARRATRVDPAIALRQE